MEFGGLFRILVAAAFFVGLSFLLYWSTSRLRLLCLFIWIGLVLWGENFVGVAFWGRDSAFENSWHCRLKSGFDLRREYREDGIDSIDAVALYKNGTLLVDDIKAIREGDGWIAGLTKTIDGTDEHYFHIQNSSGNVSAQKVEGLDYTWIVRARYWFRWGDLGFAVVLIVGAVAIWRWG